ncbi:conjugal transfer protein MobB [Flavihumibacter cheonanensis]|uniref:relaxase/mobilization nuclease domain-containing protein n=1 Tax=Flavihumibacter cheonanensis TaxID=1442385 RepID=UPI001EF7685E|nr:relaxase/mobilization nuclease domain-containing protein [Flavihumibacter cheonanensis]MCG7752230.1 relaxase/mobilization nuclease domain-containing protein [Flavihumibacter cheonanensis]
MVAVIKTGSSIHRILNYNENKVKEKVATCIAARNFPLEPEQLTLNQKLNRFLHQLQLNKNVTRNSVHISLNFHPSESNLSTEKLQAIATTYMEGIGFGKQPYLVYQHQDAGHPHIHIVSIKVQPDGSRIDMNNIGRNQSEKIRQEIEKSFKLVSAKQSHEKPVHQLRPIPATKVSYGKAATKAAIQSVLDNVLQQYRYTSLPELNAVLNLYNVSASRGTPNSRTFQTKGLFYQVLDEQKQPIGVPIKASLFYNKPTLKFLENQFQKNESLRKAHAAYLKATIDEVLSKSMDSFTSLTEALARKQVDVVLRQNKTGQTYGITFVDHRNKCVFNGSDLGKKYTYRGLINRLTTNFLRKAKRPEKSTVSIRQYQAERWTVSLPAENKPSQLDTNLSSVLNTIIQPTQSADYLPNSLRYPSRRRKKRVTRKL